MLPRSAWGVSYLHGGHGITVQGCHARHTTLLELPYVRRILWPPAFPFRVTQVLCLQLSPQCSRNAYSVLPQYYFLLYTEYLTTVFLCTVSQFHPQLPWCHLSTVAILHLFMYVSVLQAVGLHPLVLSFYILEFLDLLSHLLLPILPSPLLYKENLKNQGLDF